jgi:hypothetical protein
MEVCGLETIAVDPSNNLKIKLDPYELLTAQSIPEIIYINHKFTSSSANCHEIIYKLVEKVGSNYQ